ncbi:MAG: pitrilysin family protein [Pseudomonadota bacterium]
MKTLFAAVFAAALSFGSAQAIDIEKVVSPGGVTAWLVSDDTVPLVSVDIAFERAGSIQDPEGKAGLVNLLASTIDEGAGDLDSVGFQTALKDNAVRLSFDGSRDHLYGNIRTVSTSVAEGFDLLRLALTDPRYDPEAVDRIRRQIVSGLRREENDPNAIVGKLWSRTVFPDHPYGTPSNGTEETVSSVTPEDLRAAHDKLMARDNLYVAVVGAIDAQTLAPLLDRAFGDLPATATLKSVPDVEPAMGLTVRQEVSTPQTAIRFGGPGLEREDEDFIPAFVMNHILGGSAFSSWLFEEVREKRGLAYSVYSYMAPFEHAAVYGGGTATRNDQAEQAIEVILAQLNRMATDGPTDEELADAKAYLTGSYALRFGTSGSIARQLLFLQMEELGMDYIEARNGLIEAVTLDDVRRAAGRIFGNGQPTVAIAGGVSG